MWRPAAKMDAPGGSRYLHARHFTTPTSEGGQAMQQHCTEPARSKTDIILEHLSSGAISIDAEGRVWRHLVRKCGKVFTLAEPRRIDHKNTLGYHAVKLTAPNGKRRSTSAHQIQWIKHNGAIPGGLEINHKDRNKSNNRLDNLELMTHSQNLQHAHDSGYNTPRGEASTQARAAGMTWEKVRYIRSEVKNGRKKVELARLFNVTATCISMIASNKRWPEKYDPINCVA